MALIIPEPWRARHHARWHAGSPARRREERRRACARRAQARRGSKAPGKRVAADKKAAAGALPQWTPAEIEEAFRRFQAAMPEPKGELKHINPFTLLVAVVLSAQATDAGVNKATPALFAAADTPQKMAALGRGAGAGADQDHRPVSHQGEERRGAVAEARRGARRRGAARRARRWRRCPASAARPRTSFSTSPSASRRSRSIPTSSAWATGPAWRPARRRSRSR